MKRGDFAAQLQSLDVPGELGPALEAVLAGDDELRIGELKGHEADGVQRLVTEPGMMPRDAVEHRRLGLRVAVEKILGLLLVLFEVSVVG